MFKCKWFIRSNIQHRHMQLIELEFFFPFRNTPHKLNFDHRFRFYGNSLYRRGRLFICLYSWLFWPTVHTDVCIHVSIGMVIIHCLQKSDIHQHVGLYPRQHCLKKSSLSLSISISLCLRQCQLCPLLISIWPHVWLPAIFASQNISGASFPSSSDHLSLLSNSKLAYSFFSSFFLFFFWYAETIF